MNDTRVVITGLGCITPIGSGVDTFWKALCNGINGVQPITQFDTTDFKTKIGGEVKDFNPQNFIDQKKIVHLGRASQFTIAAAKMALTESGISLDAEDCSRFAVSLGTTMGEPQVLEQAIVQKYASSSNNGIPAHFPRQYPCGVIAANVAAELGITGQVIMVPTACTAGNYAIGYAYDCIRLGKADVVIAGGSDPLSKIAFTGFNQLLAAAQTAVRPFDKNRDGIAVSEGAGVVILERLDRALARDASIYAEFSGYGLACDAFKMTIPDPEGSGGTTALARALRNSKVSVDTIDYISAHGTGTGENDKIETAILKKVLGADAYRIPISSIKSMLGHTMGAASAIEAVACACAIRHNTLPPTINYQTPDPECDLDYVPNTAREAHVDTVVSNAYAFAGNCSSIVLRRFKG